MPTIGPHDAVPWSAIPVISRMPETSESATKRFSPSVASPLGWANRADPGAVQDVLVSRAREHADRVRIEVEPPDLVRARHGDVEGPLARNLGDVPGAAQAPSSSPDR